MTTTTFKTAAAEMNLELNPSLSPFIVRRTKLKGWSGDTPHGYNSGPSEVEIKCVLVEDDGHIIFKNGSIFWASIYRKPDGTIFAVRQKAGSARSIGILRFYDQKDFAFTVMTDAEYNAAEELDNKRTWEDCLDGKIA